MQTALFGIVELTVPKSAKERVWVGRVGWRDPSPRLWRQKLNRRQQLWPDRRLGVRVGVRPKGVAGLP
jgi:hypothetical protein